MGRGLRRRGRAAGEVLPSSPPISPVSPPVRPLLEKQSQEELGSIAATLALFSSSPSTSRRL